MKYYIQVYVWLCSLCFYGQGPELNLSFIGTGPFIATDQSAWALFRNMAGLGETDSWTTLLAYQYPYRLKELQSLVCGVIVPSNPKLGISIFQSGSNSLQNRQLAISSAKAVGGLDLGIRIKYWSLSFAGNHHIDGWSIAIGMQIPLTEKIMVGAFIDNVSQNKISHEQILPRLWFTGITYAPTEKLKLVFEIGQGVSHFKEVKLGFDYLVKDKLSVRNGFNSVNRQGYLGVGFNIGQLQVDYSLAFHLALGISHQAGLCYSWH